jgi:paraquat-inducible protein B
MERMTPENIWAAKLNDDIANAEVLAYLKNTTTPVCSHFTPFWLEARQ